MGVSVLFLSTGLVAFLIAGYRGVLRARGRRKPTEVPLMVSVIAVGLAFVFLAPAVQTVESRLVPSLGRLLSNVSTLVAAFGFLHLMLYITHPAEQVPPKARRRLVAPLIAIGAMAVLFFASDRPTGLGVFTGLYRDQPTLAAYALIYSAYLGIAMVDLGILAVRSVRYTRIWLRLGMILIAIGALLAIGYLTQKVIGVLGELVTHSAPAESLCPSAFATVGCTFAVGMPALATLAILLGATLPTLGPRLERLIRALAQWRAYRRLEPLWETLHDALPDLALAAPDVPAHEIAPNISERLYRRVVAIRDGLLALAPYRDLADTRKHRDLASSTGLTPSRRAAAIEAADIRAALQRRQHAPATAPSRKTAVTPPAGATQNDLTSEIRWLTQVSDALACGEIPPVRHAGSEH